MDFKNAFEDFANKHGLNYQYREVHEEIGYNCAVTHSLFNESGCFTVECVYPPRDTLTFYYAKSFSENRAELKEKELNVFDYEKDIWDKHRKIWKINKLCFYETPKKVIKALFEVMDSLIAKNNEFFGVKVND